MVAGGFTPGEADKLRRAMAAWKRKGGIGPFREKLISGILARGYSAEYAEQIYLDSAQAGPDTAAPRSAPISIGAAAREPNAILLTPTEGRDIVADQAHTALTLRRHPLALPRDRLAAMRLATAKQVNRARKRQPIRAAGIVTCHLHKVRPAEAGRLLFRASRHSP